MDSRASSVANGFAHWRRRDAPMLGRRAFLVGAGAAAVLVACGRGRQQEATPTVSPGQPLAFTSAAAELAVGDERVAFGVFRGGQPLGYSRDVSGLVGLRDPKGRELDPVRVRTFPIVRSTGGKDAERATEDATLVCVGRLDLDRPGRWDALARLEIDGRPEVAIGSIDVLAKSRTVGVEGRAIDTPTPTTDDARGVDPICTRDPMCTMHDVSLDDALRSGKPTVVTFATPALCESRMCGPDVDIVEEVQRKRPNVANFIHVEIYKNSGGRRFAPATRAWSIDKAGEPWVFFVAADGTVRDRLSGPVGRWEVDEGVDRLVRS